VSTTGTRERLLRRADVHKVNIPADIVDPLIVYFDLLQHWNRTINLTSLRDEDAAIDRLVIEPLSAAPHLPRGIRLLDVGSGGGSPAIPLALALGVQHLAMVEARERKAAFLREAVRQLGLPAEVHSARVEALSSSPALRGQFDLICARAVRLDRLLLSHLAPLLARKGQLALFVSGEPKVKGLTITATHNLAGGPRALLILASIS